MLLWRMVSASDILSALARLAERASPSTAKIAALPVNDGRASPVAASGNNPVRR